MAVVKKAIYAEDLLAAIRDDPNINGAHFARVRGHIEAAPPADTVEVVHARWVNVQTLGSGCVGFCSNCMTPHKANNATALRMDYRYCRWCGAKMDGGNEDG